MADIIEEFEAAVRGEADADALRRIEEALADPEGELSVYVRRQMDADWERLVEQGDPYFLLATQSLLEIQAGVSGGEDSGDGRLGAEDSESDLPTDRTRPLRGFPIPARVAAAACAALLLFFVTSPLWRHAIGWGESSIELVDASVVLRTSVAAGGPTGPEEVVPSPDQTVALPKGATFSLIIGTDLGPVGSLLVLRQRGDEREVVFQSDDLEKLRPGPGQPLTVRPFTVTSDADYLVILSGERRPTSLEQVAAEQLASSPNSSIREEAWRGGLVESLRRRGYRRLAIDSFRVVPETR